VVFFSNIYILLIISLKNILVRGIDSDWLVISRNNIKILKLRYLNF
jgi:hypothetical protein